MRLNDLPLKPLEAIHLVLAAHASIPLRQHFRNVPLETLFYLKTKKGEVTIIVLRIYLYSIHLL